MGLLPQTLSPHASKTVQEALLSGQNCASDLTSKTSEDPKEDLGGFPRQSCSHTRLCCTASNEEKALLGYAIADFSQGGLEGSLLLFIGNSII